jgi:hypothetical protein
VLIVEDDERIGASIEQALKAAGSAERRLVQETALYDPATQVHDRTWFVPQADGQETVVRFKSRVYFPQELDNLLRLA